MKLNTFKISFKLYYHELCDWGSEYVKASTKRAALRKFARGRHLDGVDMSAPESWRWWEDDWYNAFHSIEKIATKQ